MVSPVGAGVDRHTGKPIAGWPHVLLCLECIFTTHFGTRVIRRWFGSLVPVMLGRNIEPSTLLNFMTAIYAALDFEPRFALTKITIISSADDLRVGKLELYLDGVYRPRAHLGDFTAEGPRRILISNNEGRLTARMAT